MPGSDSTTFTVATGGATTDRTRVAKGEKLVAFSATVDASDPPVLVRGSLNFGTHGHVLFSGWLRGHSIGGSEQALFWTGEFPIPERTMFLEISVRNDTGATVTVTYNWVLA